MIAIKNILVPNDFSVASDAALMYGRSLAKQFGARLHVLHVVDNAFLRASVADPHAHEAAELRRLNERITDDDRERLGASVVMVKSDSPAVEITAYALASQIDLIVMGTHGRSGISHALVGSVAERVVRTAPCAVLTVRHPEHEFVTPDKEMNGNLAVG